MVNTNLANSLSFTFWYSQRIQPYFAGSQSRRFVTHLQAYALLMSTLLDGYQIRLPVEPPFIPASGFDG
ncbi:MAG TPA: hypothetical protein V6D35_20680 [Candidatus Sericytochromatia bacterium]